MTLRHLTYIVAGLVCLTGFWGCNSDEYDWDIEQLKYTDVSVNSFKLVRNESILAHLDTVFFAVDLDRRTVFNPDSLPVGIDSVSTPVKMSLPSVSVAMLYFDTYAGADSVNYLESPGDTVDFSRGPVRLHLVSYDGTNSADYTIKLNVHKMQPDSLWWNATATRPLPSSLSAPLRQRTIEWRGAVWCLTANASELSLQSATHPAEEVWTSHEVNLPEGADISTLTACGDKLVILDSQQHLHTSADAVHWTNTGVRMSYIYGEYAGSILGTVETERGYVSLCWPEAADAATAPLLPAGAPVRGCSNPLTFNTTWSASPQLTVMGGYDADGNMLSACWTYEGGQWAATSMVDAPARSGSALVPYFTVRTNAYWIVTQRSVLLSFGGQRPDGYCDNTMYVSFDRGIHWSKADALMQPPTYLPAVWGADVSVHKVHMDGRSRSVWQEMPDTPLPSRARIAAPLVSRSAEPNTSDTLITEWDTPYIYMFGGRYNTGMLQNRVWRGAVNRLTFKPLQ